MTVEDLLEDFIEFQCQRLCNLFTKEDITESADGDAESWTKLENDVEKDSIEDRCYRAAKLYVIARDQGMDAAVLWKLQYG